MPRVALLLSAFVLAACGKTVGDGEPATRADCTQVQEHSAQLRIADVRANSKLSSAELDKHERNFAKATSTYLDQCVEERSKGWAQCMLKLETLNGAKDCNAL